jgi:hypothetical protein
MFGWLRGKGRIEWQTPPHEPAGPIAAQEMQIEIYDAAAHAAYLGGDRELMDRLLDERLAIRPARDAPPVRAIPGRPT